MKNIKLKNNIIHIHQLGFPINLEIIIPKDDSVRTLYEVTEGLDYSKLYEAYSTEGRNPMILPETLFRIVAYGYMEGIGLMSIFWTQKVKLFYAALLANNSH